jgi:hypothetical protein
VYAEQLAATVLTIGFADFSQLHPGSRTFYNKLKEGFGKAAGYLHSHTFATVLTDSSTSYSNTMAILLSNDIGSVMNLMF